uniref:Uncharacterized protein n=1 Tax=Anguilla anguilla TaxID=7936 RepID=A0A0E9VFP5_ANGAN
MMFRPFKTTDKSLLTILL